MPTYEYECNACGHKFDELQSFSDTPLTQCPKCKKKQLHRLFGGGAGFIFKGSGFYCNDYQGKNASLSNARKISDSINKTNGEKQS